MILQEKILSRSTICIFIRIFKGIGSSHLRCCVKFFIRNFSTKDVRSIMCLQKKSASNSYEGAKCRCMQYQTNSVYHSIKKKFQTLYASHLVEVKNLPNVPTNSAIESSLGKGNKNSYDACSIIMTNSVSHSIKKILQFLQARRVYESIPDIYQFIS